MTRARKHLIRTATLCMSVLPALALAHPGHAGEHGFDPAFIVIGVLGLIAASAAATRLVTAATTAVARRSRI